jgi:hypothetical protein
MKERMAEVWERQERGWYIAEGVGGIVNEHETRPQWFFYPVDEAGHYCTLNIGKREGPFKTLKLAKHFVKNEMQKFRRAAI